MEKLKKTKFCVNCGAEIDVNAEICPKCGVRQPLTRSDVKSAGLAAVLSFFIPGLGQIYNGQIGKGIVFMILIAISILLMEALIGFITTPILWIWGIFDAYRTAERINTGQM